MEQHISNRDYVASRNVIEAVRRWNIQGGKLGSTPTMKEFEEDPLGKK